MSSPFRLALYLALLFPALLPSADAQYEALLSRLRKSWDQTVPGQPTGGAVDIEYSAANSLATAISQTMGGKGVLLAGKRRALYRFTADGKRYELYQKGPALAYRAGKAEFRRAQPKDRREDPVLRTFVEPEVLVQELTRAVQKIRTGRSQGVRGVLCRAYDMTYQEHQVSGLLKRLGLTARSLPGKKTKTYYRATFWVEAKTQRVRELHVSFRVLVEKPSEKEKKKEFSWGAGGSGGRGGVGGKGADGQPQLPPKLRQRTQTREYSLKLTLLSPAQPTRPIEIPAKARQLIGW